jgi:hypothetical protein
LKKAPGDMILASRAPFRRTVFRGNRPGFC